jgi:alkylhydroperoxidase family enzyme
VHVATFAQAAQLNDAQVRATVLEDADAPCWSPAEQALLAAVDALHAGATLGDDQFKALSAHYDDAKIFEIILLCGFYRTVSYLANGLDLPLEERAARFPN